MEDQVARASARGLRTLRLGGARDEADRAAQRARLLGTPAPELVYVAPEGLTAGWGPALAGLDVRLLAVDEAHCVDRWGSEFRPDYLELGAVREALGSPPCVAVTASASPATASSVANVLRMRDPVTVRTSCVRDEPRAARLGRARPEGSRLPRGRVREPRRRERDRLHAQPGRRRRHGRAAADAGDAMPRRTMPASTGPSGAPSSSASSPARPGSSSRPSPSAWGSTSPTSGGSCTAVCRSRWTPTTRRSVAPAGTALLADCLLLWSLEDLRAHRAMRARHRATATAATRRSLESDAMLSLASGSRCRHASVAAWFGETTRPCGDRCDACARDSGAGLALAS